jgi:hypothetical protein
VGRPNAPRRSPARPEARARRAARAHNKLGMVTRSSGRQVLQAYSAAHQLDLTDQATIRGSPSRSVEGLGASLTTSEGPHLARRGRERGARGLFKLRCISASRGGRSGPSTTSRRLLASTTHRRPSGARRSTRPQDWKQVVAYKRRSSTTSSGAGASGAAQDRRHLERPGQEPTSPSSPRGGRAPARIVPAPQDARHYRRRRAEGG